ncbi:alpha/beta fold hydrolase [Motilibacter aurantiacus]|uniref:alpha/beta fold hydrolase n=1 Tax=Motilibacter aurantiacus TaxID=2714955 RepID=UPI00140DF6E4|nr:alpha/beta hydrolase [Motilibacter aurantiacus]NHC46019.1 alpha/beta hydrolase [Motilibacter aurantiacus]
MTTSYLQLAGGRIAYDVTGDGPLVVCLPGMGDVRSVYRFLVPALVAAGFRVATMDLRGHGESDVGFDSYDDVAAGRDALALVEHLGGPALLVGSSMGAGASVWAAAERPGAVRGLVLAGPFVRDPRPRRLVTLALRVALLRPWGPAVWRAYYRALHPGRRPADLADHLARIAAAQRRPGAWRAFAATTRTSHAPVQARIAEVAAPVLVVMGERDADWPDPAAEGRWVADALRGELLLVEDAGHYPLAEYPELVAPAVRDFARAATARA